MLEKLNLSNPKSKNIVERFLEHRNDIAHGRKSIYQDKAIYPLLPFFSLVKDIDVNLDSIRILTGRIISAFLEIDLFIIEWILLMTYEPIPYEIVKEFIKNKKYDGLKPKQIQDGFINGITPHTLSFYYLKNKKEVTLSILEEILSELILSIKVSDKNSWLFFHAALILTDSKVVNLANKSKEIIISIDKNKWLDYSNIRDVLKEFEYSGNTLIWLKNWLTNGKPEKLLAT